MNRIARASPLPLAATGATMVLLGTSVCFGLVPLFARGLQGTGADSATIALSRYGLSALLLLPWLPRSRDKRREALLVAAAGLAMGLSWIGYLEAIKTVPIAMAGIVYMSYPLFTLLFAWLLVGQRPDRRSGAAVTLILLASTLALAPRSSAAWNPLALLLVIPAPIAFGFIIVIISAWVRRLSPLERAASAMLGAVIGLVPLSLGANVDAALRVQHDSWSLIAGMALVTAFLPQLLYSYAAPLVGPSRCAAAGSFELPTMFLVGWLAFGEAIGAIELLAAALITAAVVVSPPIRITREQGIHAVIAARSDGRIIATAGLPTLLRTWFQAVHFRQ